VREVAGARRARNEAGLDFQGLDGQVAPTRPAFM
jgi:hypothetical protein